jgi:hypothetical protein
MINFEIRLQNLSGVKSQKLLSGRSMLLPGFEMAPPESRSKLLPCKHCVLKIGSVTP